MTEEVTFKDWGVLYAMWRFRIWSEVGSLTYNLIDQAVKDGTIKPGSSAEDVRAALSHRR